jgi:hypothetical protein
MQFCPRLHHLYILSFCCIPWNREREFSREECILLIQQNDHILRQEPFNRCNNIYYFNLGVAFWLVINNLLVCLFVLLIAAWAIFQLSGGCHHYRWLRCKFRPMLGAQGLWAGRDLYRDTPTATRDLGLYGLLRKTGTHVPCSGVRTPNSRIICDMLNAGR